RRAGSVSWRSSRPPRGLAPCYNGARGAAMQRILVLGGGFAGLWAAAGAARERAGLGRAAGTVEVGVVDRHAHPQHRVRKSEPDLSDVAIPLARVLDPIDVRHLQAEVRGIAPARRAVDIAVDGRTEAISYDALVVALGSALVRPPVPGLAQYGFDIDTYAA